VAVWVKLKSIQFVERQGKLERHNPGDWVHVGRQTAERWIAQGLATRPNGKIDIPAGAGVWLRGLAVPGCQVLESLPFVEDDGSNCLPYPRTMVWNPALGCRTELLSVGFRLLERWQMAAPLLSYEQLACHIGSDEDRVRTQAVIRDLRVPVYDTRLMFIRRCAETMELVKRWLEDDEGDERLSFLRALYAVKPVICALPTSWMRS
jgi:hypothetical protein